MRPVITNPKSDLRKIHDAIADLTKVVGEIKSALIVKDHIGSPYWSGGNASTSADGYDEEG